jgi:hypothetical protein
MLKKANLEFSGISFCRLLKVERMTAPFNRPGTSAAKVITSNVIFNKLELVLRVPRPLVFVYSSPSFTFSSFPPTAFTGLFITSLGFQSPENAVLLYFPF